MKPATGPTSSKTRRLVSILFVSLSEYRLTPLIVIHGTVRPYQLQGLNWMVSLHHNGLNGILADEMGPGKMLQSISFLAYFRHVRDVHDPHLVVVPKSTLRNWAREFEKWAPSFSSRVPRMSARS